jgi:CRP-like cAMP-binding protein
LVSGCSEVSYKKGQVIIEEGARGDDMFVLTRGAASVEAGGKQVALLSAGAPSEGRKSASFGELALISDEPRKAGHGF